ncbi:centromere protein R [Heteronotia binoei]|uniref:centromere protein R n=1 Tax=Heteronotia binoei TaxID=13085 RepID=UPI00292F1F88|nr:centromere protein R [Heteronotia binoei]XP_060087922.1 centromere protein R [Heteronotia binoei]
MPVKRVLKLDSFTTEKEPTTPLQRRKKNCKSYSPTTGTRLISPFSTPRSNNVQEHRHGLSNGSRNEVHDLPKSSSKQGQPQIEKNDKFLMAQPTVEDSVEKFLQLRQKLIHLQALEGIREPENIVGVSNNSCNLKSEVRKNKKLMEQVRKLKWLRRSHGGLPAQGCHRHVNSFEFFKSLIE